MSITRSALIEDLQQLIDTLDQVHPDPYIHEGRVSYHKRYQLLVQSLPESMSIAEAYAHLQSFLAPLHDSHTLILPPGALLNPNTPGGLPIQLDVVGQVLFITGVGHESDKHLLGQKLLGIESIDIDDIIDRVYAFISSDNRFTALSHLSERRILTFSAFLSLIIPEWSGNTISITTDSGEHTLSAATSMRMITAGEDEMKGLSYTFMDDVAYLKLDGSNIYHEYAQSHPQQLRELYLQYHHHPPMGQSDAEMLDSLPSLVELLTKLFTTMFEQKTKRLIVDLRRNTGGTSTMLYALLYYLGGYEVLHRVLGSSYEIQKYSELFISQNNIDLTKIGYPDQVHLRSSDYNFSSYPEFRQMNSVEHTRSQLESFFRAVIPGILNYTVHCLPELVVITGPSTLSSGFDISMALKLLGAKVIGTTPGQNINFFGNSLRFSLQHTGFMVNSSTKLFIKDDTVDMHAQLLPDIPLEFDQLGSSGFNPSDFANLYNIFLAYKANYGD
ncbi:MAG: hypothetical protein INQ03_10515 [Candidatus Heimdallarchaeota archaeon]|nr:hypothetical protein [Candidatus Heimdallarchaeota archaeon]